MPVVIPPGPDSNENWYEDDPALRELLALHLGSGGVERATPRLRKLGTEAPARLDAWARLADRHRPILRREKESDEVDFHPSYRELQRAAREHEVFTLAWRGEPRVLAFALGYLYAQAECGYYCPACMTDGAAFVLARHAPAPLKDALVPRLTSRTLNGAFEGAMYLTERGGGSDVGGGTETRAAQTADGSWRLSGEKWFASNCVADVALALARMPSNAPGTSGLGLFVVPRRLADGRPNPGLRIRRLKEKLGVTSMPTGEVLLENAHAEIVAPERAGFKAMAEMVNLSRLYNAVASVAIARRALREGERAGRLREAFGKRLEDQPLFAQSLLALQVDVEGALALTLDTAEVFDRHARGDAEALPILRALTPCAKAMTAKLAVRAASDACEFLGGVGYTEEYVTPRLLRDAQVLPIWEGTTNVQALEFAGAAEKLGAVSALVAHSRARLVEAKHAHAAKLAEEALARLERERVTEPAALRLLASAYHAHATACLARVPGERAQRVADLYADVHLAKDERALERVPR